jgi:toxin YoeB
MSYILKFTPNALKDIAFHQKSGDKAVLKKLAQILKELQEHPETGIGRPERLKYGLSGQWSRKITDKHRLVYEVFEAEIVVEVIQAKDHYNDK